MSADSLELSNTTFEAMITQIHDSLLRAGDADLRARDLAEAMETAGLDAHDKRIRATMRNLRRIEASLPLNEGALREIIAAENATLIARALAGDLIIPSFGSFKRRIGDIFDEVQRNTAGEVATYIPQLARVDPDLFSIAVCTIDGQQFSLGDDDETFCVQSTCKPTNYAIALDERGEEEVHQHVGREPSGLGFSELTLNQNGLPHNPMINAGAIACTSLIQPKKSNADRFDHVMRVWKALCGGRRPGFDNSVFLSERETADRNFALAYMMREQGAFPKDANILQTLDFYFQTCSITVDVRQMAVLAATYANGGVCPTTSERVLQSGTVKDVLSLMYSCGMYDFSGEYAFSVGIPAKSGVSGALFMVIPGLCGIAIYSPRLDALGNSVRGVEFSKRLVAKFAFHTYANVEEDQSLIDPRKPSVERAADAASYLCLAASRGDIGELRRLVASGFDPSTADYDGRTAMHLAACEGQVEAITYLLSVCSEREPKDRWGNSPLDDARREGHDSIIELLSSEYAPSSA